MALLNKLFSPKKKVDNRPGRDLKQNGVSFRPFPIKKDDVRVLLFKDCEQSGRRLLFDSSSIKKIPIDCANKNFQNEFSKFCQKSDSSTTSESATPDIVEVSNGFAYQFKPSSNDGGLLSEMIFGTVAMNYHGVSLKFHILKEPQRLMCAKVFGVPARTNNQGSKVGSTVSNSETHSGHPRRSQWSSLTLPIETSTPMKIDSGYSLSFSIGRGDSGFYCGSSQSSESSSYMHEFWCKEDSHDDTFCNKSFCSSPKLNSYHSSSSFNRRLQRNLSTRLNSHCFLEVPQEAGSQSAISTRSDLNVRQSSLSGGTTTDSLMSFSSSASGSSARRIKLGLAIIVSLTEKLEMEMLRYLLQHSPQLESMLMRLAAAATTAGMCRSKRKNSRSGDGFISAMNLAANEIVLALSNLMGGPRIPSLWLNFISVKEDSKASNVLYERLVQNLSILLSTADTKDTNFFVSTLMTSLLTHHLGWVSTVSPYEVNSTDSAEPWNILTIKHPYNPLWAQLGDLYGALGNPLKTCRTILCGIENSNFLTMLLSILTYFLRCGRIETHAFEFGKFDSRISTQLDSRDCDKMDLNANNITCHPIQEKKPSGLKRMNKFNNNIKLDALEMMDDTDLQANNNYSESADLQNERSVLFVLGENEKLIGLKKENVNGVPPSTSMYCSVQSCQHSKSKKHSGVKFEFDKYPQIVTNYLKSKNLEWLDRNYIGKPGNIKINGFDFEPSTSLTVLEDDGCEQCQLCSSTGFPLQTPSNASELEFTCDLPKEVDYQHAKENIASTDAEVPKTFVRRHLENTVIINAQPTGDGKEIANEMITNISFNFDTEEDDRQRSAKFIELPFILAEKDLTSSNCHESSFDYTLLGDVSDNYIPDMILQGVLKTPEIIEQTVRRELSLCSQGGSPMDQGPNQAIAIIADTQQWCVRIWGIGGADYPGVFSPLVASIFDVLPLMIQSKTPARQCISYIESKLRELCTRSKTLADFLMSTDLCDMAYLTKVLNIDANDVPLLMAIATTHTPQISLRYGVSFR